MIIQLIFAAIILVFSNTEAHHEHPSPSYCSSCDDPHMNTFDSLAYDFHEFGQHFILYTDYDKTLVTASYGPCSESSEFSCNCAVYIKYDDTIIFLDVCGISSYNVNLQFYYTMRGEHHTYAASCHSKLMDPADETNDEWWNQHRNPVRVNSKLLCAKMADTDTYMIRTNNKDMNENIYVKVILHPLGITCIYVQPSINSFENNGGLCGSWDDDPTNDGFIMDKLGRKTIFDLPFDETTISKLALYWRLTNDKKVPNFKKFDKDLFCPCDTEVYHKFNDWDNNLAAWMQPDIIGVSCCNLVSQCVLQSENKYVKRQATVRLVEPKPVDLDTALKTCNNSIMDDDIKQAVKFNMVKIDPIMKMCVEDYMKTGDDYWPLTHNNLARNQAIRNIQQSKRDFVKQSSLKTLASMNHPYKSLMSKNSSLIDSLKRPLQQRFSNFNKILQQGQEDENTE